jgi:hypothetical protein
MPETFMITITIEEDRAKPKGLIDSRRGIPRTPMFHEIICNNYKIYV